MARKSLRNAVNAMCRNCIYDPGAAGYAIVQIEACTAVDCPLWDVRPVRSESARRAAPWNEGVLQTVRHAFTPEEAAAVQARPHEVPARLLEKAARGAAQPGLDGL